MPDLPPFSLPAVALPGGGSDKILVSDFDGTMTGRDFFRAALAYLPAHYLENWERYEAGELTHLAALTAIFAGLQVSDAEMADILVNVGLEPGVVAGAQRLQTAGWRLVIASAGCDWYIRRLLSEVKPSPVIYANPGTFVAGQGMQMKPNVSLPYYAPDTGINKGRIVQVALLAGATVAFAGDGRPDLDPIMRVPPSLRFARGWLAEELERRGGQFNRFDQWSEVVAALL